MQVHSVRENALHLLRLLAERAWQDGPVPRTPMRPGALLSSPSSAWGDLLHQASNGSVLADAAGVTLPPA